MGDAREEHREAVALFRYRVPAPVLNESPERTAAVIREQAGKVWDIPGSQQCGLRRGRSTTGSNSTGRRASRG